MSDHLLGGRYRLQRPLGRGGTATVWQARDTRLDRGAAVKILDARSRADPAALHRLRREARSVARLAHDNIVGMYDIADDAAYLVMELVDGRSLTDVLTCEGRLPVARAVSIAAQICDALGAAHAAGVVHRDVKPSNILVDSSDVVKVCDFGVALLDRAAADLALTGDGAVVGTCQYMAPEQAAGDPVDGRADLYAVGCVLYAMLTGAPPFAANHPIDVLDLHLHEPPVPLRAHRDDVPSDLQALVAELLAKHPADRPATAASARDRLRAIGDPATPAPAGLGDPATPARAGWSDPATPATAGLGDPATPATAGLGDPATPPPAGVVAPTLTLPTLPDRPDGRHSRPRRRWALDRRIVLAATAGALAVLATSLVVALAAGDDRPATSAGRPPPAPAISQDATDTAAPSAEPSSAPTEIASTTPPATATPARVSPIARLADLAAVVQRESAAGRLRPKAAKTMLRDLTGVARALDAGETSEAAERFAEFRDRVRELRADGQLTGVTLPGLDEITESLGAG